MWEPKFVHIPVVIWSCVVRKVNPTLCLRRDHQALTMMDVYSGWLTSDATHSLLPKEVLMNELMTYSQHNIAR